ncbi:MAG TPA: HNH endonuclease [Terriglobia bacterium]|nr:HNH endonuclease [Terriglobia bacterium]
MPAVPAQVLSEALLSAVYEAGWSGALVSPISRHPKIFSIVSPEGSQCLLSVYVWTLTFGGRVALRNEYRIQMTGVAPPLEASTDGPTVLLGYEPDLRLFAGFDLVRHRNFTPGSPSIQVDIGAVRQALQDGLSFYRKTNDEISVGIRPDQLLAYAFNAADLHRYGRDARVLPLLVRASSLQPIADAEISVVAPDRQRIIQTISRLSRLGNFRQQVLRAYGDRCAVTRMQLRLVDAAHILPVGAPGSLDDVTNGIALSPTFHRAYDAGLIYLASDYRMIVNQDRVAELQNANLIGGLETLRAGLGRILLPPDRRQWPSPTLIQRANRYRGVVV